MIFEFDDFGADHIISDQCQSHDCRDQLLRLKEVNPGFKATLFAIPGEMTPELLEWSKLNSDWIELAVHGFYHSSNWECAKITYKEFDNLMTEFKPMIDRYFARTFRAPGWQISDDAFMWLKDHNWIVADQGYNDERRPPWLNAYINYDGQFTAHKKDSINYLPVEAYHGHTWNVGWNGIYEDYDKVERLVREATEFKFIGELF